MLLRFNSATLGHSPGRTAMWARNRPVAKPSASHKPERKSISSPAPSEIALIASKLPPRSSGGLSHTCGFHLHRHRAQRRQRLLLRGLRATRCSVTTVPRPNAQANTLPVAASTSRRGNHHRTGLQLRDARTGKTNRN